MSSLNAARIITILYFQTLSIVQVSVPENCQAMKTQEKIYTGNEREKIISYTLTSIQTILAQNRFAKIAYEYFKSLKEPYVSPIASNIIKPIILMSLIKLKVKNKLEFTNMNLKKSLNSIKNKIGEILGHYPNLLVNISELTLKQYQVVIS